MVNFENLPFDVIDCILNCDIITFVDICRLSCVSKLFNSMSKSNRLWRKKYQKMWPDLAALFVAHNVDWRNECKIRLHYKKLIAKKLLDLSAEYYHLENVSNEAFLYFKDIGREHEFGYAIIVNELETILEDSNSHLNLTIRYYGAKALRYVRHLQLENIWRHYLVEPSAKLSLIEGACLISQWCQPSVSKCTSKVSSQIEDVTRQVLVKIEEKFPHHPVLKIKLLSQVPEKSLWTPLQCKNILCCINDVMFQNSMFSGSEIDYYSADTSFIDKVLEKKTGISITLGIIYSTIAGKLGVVCLSVNFPGHFLLKWLEHPQFSDDKEAYTFIDVIEKGMFKKYNDLKDLVPGYQNLSQQWTETVSPLKVFVRMAWYLVEFGRQLDVMGEDSLVLCNSLELLCLLSPDDMEHKLLLARLFMHLSINITDAISMLQEIAANDPLSPLTAGYMYQSTLQTLEIQKITRPFFKTKKQLRNEDSNVKFAVGMIMRHKKYNFRCVIYGWDYTCSASSDWIKRMGVHNLEYQDKQPFYNVLVDDGTNRYAAQENLMIDSENKPINHVKIGRYFESFHGRYYLPNPQTLSEYPHDIEAREKALNNYI